MVFADNLFAVSDNKAVLSDIIPCAPDKSKVYTSTISVNDFVETAHTAICRSIKYITFSLFAAVSGKTTIFAKLAVALILDKSEVVTVFPLYCAEKSTTPRTVLHF